MTKAAENSHRHRGPGQRRGGAALQGMVRRSEPAAEEGRDAAYVFVMGSLAELLRCFDFPIVFPEINSLQTAVRHVAHEYLNEAEDYGYSPDICGYVKADVATQLRGGAHPMGRIPEGRESRSTRTPATPTSSGPRSGSACTTARRSRSTCREAGSAGLHPGPGDPDFENDRSYVLAQLRRS
jgi:benzoyl-CoA reductase subunit B